MISAAEQFVGNPGRRRAVQLLYTGTRFIELLPLSLIDAG